MSKAKTADPNYVQLKSELDAVLTTLQREDLAVDQAVIDYQRGLELVKQLETYLKTAENKVIELQTTFNNQAAK